MSGSRIRELRRPRRELTADELRRAVGGKPSLPKTGTYNHDLDYPSRAALERPCAATTSVGPS